MVKSTCVAWRSGMYRQAVPSQEPRISVRCMRRLAAMNSPPGGFWEISRIHHFQSNNTDSAKYTYIWSYNCAINNIRRGSAPLTWFLSLNLNTWWSSPLITKGQPWFPSIMPSTPSRQPLSLTLASIFLSLSSALPKPCLNSNFFLLN